MSLYQVDILNIISLILVISFSDLTIVLQFSLIFKRLLIKLILYVNFVQGLWAGPLGHEFIN